MLEAIADTGPCLHLSDIDCPQCLSVFDRLTIVQGVKKELEDYQVDLSHLDLDVVFLNKAPGSWRSAMKQTGLQPADAQVLALAKSRGFSETVLTDDLALRKCVEQEGGGVAGSVGLLVRSYRLGHFELNELLESADRLMSQSTLFMSKPFRTWLRKMLEELELKDSKGRRRS